MSYCHYYWLANRAWILSKDFGRGPNMIPMQNPMSTLNKILLAITLELQMAQSRSYLYMLGPNVGISYMLGAIGQY